MRKLILFELRKLFAARVARIALAVLLLLTLLLAVTTYHNKYAFDGVSQEGSGRDAVAIDQAVAEKYEGILTTDKVRQMMSDFAPKVDLHGMNAAYLYQNAVQSSLFARFSDQNGTWNGRSVSEVFGEEEIIIGYNDGWLSTSENLAKVFVLLSLVIMVILAPVFSGEYGGVDQIILSSRYGKTKCAVAKAIASFLATLLITSLTAAVNLVPALLLYGSGGLDCSILFAPASFVGGFIPFNITCGTLLKYQILLAFTGAVSVAAVTLTLSAACKNQMVTLAASAALYLLPMALPVSEASPLFRWIGLFPLYHAQFISLMSIDQMENGVLYAIWALPVAIFLAAAGSLASRRIFARHEIA